MSLLILTLFGMTFSLLPGETQTSVIPEEFRWLRVPLEDAMLFFLGLAMVITFLEMLKELRKKYAWQKSLRIFIEKAIMNEFSSRDSIAPIRMMVNMQKLDISRLLKEKHEDALKEGSTIDDWLRDNGLIRKLGARGRIKIEASPSFFCLALKLQQSWSIAQAMTKCFDPRKIVRFLEGIKTTDEMRPIKQVKKKISANLDCAYHALPYDADKFPASRLPSGLATF